MDPVPSFCANFKESIEKLSRSLEAFYANNKLLADETSVCVAPIFFSKIVSAFGSQLIHDAGKSMDLQGSKRLKKYLNIKTDCR